MTGDPSMKAYWRERYERALHAMQTGVKMLIDNQGTSSGEASPKHLRVGVNAAMIDAGAQVSLLIKKGIFTEEEYFQALAEFSERDQKSYEEKVALVYGPGVKLG